MIADGYKDTEVGVIPIEWEVVSLGDILEYEQPTKYLVETTEYDDSYTTPVLTAGKTFILGYTNETSGICKNLPAIIFDDFTTASKYVDFPFKAKSSAMKILKVKNKKYPTRLFYEYLNDVEFFASTHKRYWISEYQNLKVPFPPLKEQEKIADILSTADDKIDAIASQIEKAETLKKGLLQKLLSEGIGHSVFKDSELGKIPLSWEVVELGSCVNGKGNYGIGAASVNYDEYLPTYLRITDIDDNGKFISTNKKCVDSPDSSNYQLQDGDIVFARTGNTTGKTYLYNPDDGVLIYAGFLIKFTPNKEILNTYYLKLQASTARYWNWVKVTSMRTGQPGINSEEYGNFLLPLPPLEEQKQIADILSTTDEKLEVLRAKKSKFETLKKALLQKLLSGEVRV